MVDQVALIRAFADYARTLSGGYDIGEVLYRLTDHAQEVLNVGGAGVSLGDQGGVLRFVTATDEKILRVEERQAAVGQGPCHDAYLSGDRVTCADLAVEERWPDYSPVALAQGCRAVAGIPMAVGEQRIGALNLYSREPHEWPADQMELAQVLADMATSFIVNARALSETQRVNAQLQHALDSRVIIEQAKGVLAERHRSSPAAAFDQLRRHARQGNLKIHDVARHVVDGSLRL